MKTHISATRPAGLAIAAALALTPLSLFAQEAPTSVAPAADPAPATAPPEAAATAPDPVVAAPDPVAAAPDPAPVTTTTVTRTTRTVAPAPVRTTTRTTTASPVVAPVVARTVTSTAPVVAVPVEAVPSALPETTVAPLPADEPVVAPAPQRSAFDTQMALILGGLAALAFLGWGFWAIGRRRRPSIAVVHDPVIERPLVAEPVATTPVREPIAFAPRPAPAAPSLRHTGAAVALPRTLPESHEAREELLNRMTEAKPDRANPFTSPIQRRKRARLIMQCIGKTFDHAPRIDLSQYPENWPELQSMRYADAA
jgi:hypothetical protein